MALMCLVYGVYGGGQIPEKEFSGMYSTSMVIGKLSKKSKVPLNALLLK